MKQFISSQLVSSQRKLGSRTVVAISIFCSLLVTSATAFSDETDDLALKIKRDAIKRAISDKLDRIKNHYQISLGGIGYFSVCYEKEFLEGLTNLHDHLEAGTETRKEIYMVFEEGDRPGSNDFYWDQRPTRWHSFVSTPLIEEYIAKIKKERGYVIPRERGDGSMEYLVDPSLIQMETAPARILNSTFRLNVLTENWIDMTTGWQWGYANMLKNFFELKIDEAKKNNKKIRIRKEGWENVFQILDIEDAPEFDPKRWWKNQVSLDSNLIRFELKPGSVYATQLVFFYDDEQIGFEIYNFESSAKEVLNRLNEEFNIGKETNFKIGYFPVRLLDSQNIVSFEYGFFLHPTYGEERTLPEKKLPEEKGGEQAITPKAQTLDPEKRITTTGAVFTRDTNPSHSALGETWCDPAGLCWGDLVKNEDGSDRFMIQSSEYMKEIGRPLPDGELGAKEYCKSIGARLPSKEEFIQLREYMGARSGTPEGYSPQVLPNLSGSWFWSSVNPNYADNAYVFVSSFGSIGSGTRNSSNAVRCVVSR